MLHCLGKAGEPVPRARMNVEVQHAWLREGKRKDE